MIVEVPTDHNNARLAATLAYCGNAARVQLFDARRELGGLLLAEVALADPAGQVGDGALTLAWGEPGLIVISGTASWARIVTDSDVVVIECDVSEEAGNAALKLVDVQLYAGGTVQPLSLVLR